MTPWTAACQDFLFFTVFQSLLKLMFIESVMPSKQLILCCPLLLLPLIFPSIRVFTNESALCFRWPAFWIFSINPSNEYLKLVSFRIDWFDLLAVQWTLKSLLQHHSSKASVLPCSAFFMVQLSHLYMTTGKAITLTRWTIVSKVMSLLFDMLSRLGIAQITTKNLLALHSLCKSNYCNILVRCYFWEKNKAKGLCKSINALIMFLFFYIIIRLS